MNQRRPKNLNLLTIRFPLPAFVSILHRISGVLLFLFVPFLLWGLQVSLTETGFENLKAWRSDMVINAILWLMFFPLCFHLVAGLRHLLTDILIGVTLRGGRIGALLTVIITFILILFVGVWLW